VDIKMTETVNQASQVPSDNVVDIAVRIRLRTRAWTISPGADFVNSLCPVAHPEFPDFRWAVEDTRGELEQAFKRGFYHVQKYWWSRQMDARDELTKGEHKTLMAIERKTLQFGKLFEKMPRRVFITGDLDEYGCPAGDRYGNVRLRPTGLDDRALTKALRGLQQKGWITKVASTPHPLFDVSSAYCPLPLNKALNLLLNGARTAAAEQMSSAELERCFGHMLRELQVSCRDLISEAAVSAAAAGASTPALERKA
jgi:DNA-binding HxlR family transcriptional regulator